MVQHATIFNTKGMKADGTNKKAGARRAYLDAISFESKGIGNEINDFLDNSILFASFATTYYNPNTGYKILGRTYGSYGYSYWFGLLFPDMITEDGRKNCCARYKILCSLYVLIDSLGRSSAQTMLFIKLI